MKSTDREFIGLQEKHKFANELKALLDVPAFNILLNGMIAERSRLHDEADSFKMDRELAEQCRLKSTAIKTFLMQIIKTLAEAERAQNEIDKILKFEEEQARKNFKERRGK